MTREEMLNKAIYIQYCLGNKTYKDFGIASDKIYKLPIVEGKMMYDGWKLNTHHFTTDYHMKYSIPLFKETLKLDYNRNDFILKERYSGEYDLSMLKPKKNYEYEAYGYTRGEHFDSLSFDEITSNDSNSAEITDYHRLYKYSHECSRLINKTLNNDRKLFISGDSQMIPNIAFLSCFFKEVWYFDNRKKLKLSDKYKDINFSDILIELNSDAKNDYMIRNFM